MAGFCGSGPLAKREMHIQTKCPVPQTIPWTGNPYSVSSVIDLTRTNNVNKGFQEMAQVIFLRTEKQNWRKALNYTGKCQHQLNQLFIHSYIF